MNTIGRKDERLELQRLYESDSAEFAIVYGRRRVGKTFLVRETLGDCFCFYSTGLARGNKNDQLGAFYGSLLEYGLPVQFARPKTWFEAFDLLKKVVEKSPRRRKVLFIDEMPWLDTAKSKFLTALDLFWNQWASARKDILLIGCGSAASWMVKNIIRNRGGLHNRITCKIKLSPFTLPEVKEFLLAKGIAWENRDIAETYMILGGIPYYLNLLDKHFSLAQNIDRLFFKESALLEDEFDNLYASLFKNAKGHIKIIEALAKKKSGMTREEILKETKQQDGGNVGIRLEELEQCGFIRKFKAVGNKGKFYQLTDFYTRFYLSFAKEQDENRQKWVQMQNTHRYSTWCGLAFERLCQSQIDRIKDVLRISGMASSHYSVQTDSAQIDMVIDRADRIVTLCEMKFYDQPYAFTRDDQQKLQNKISVIRELFKRKNIQPVLISPYGLRPNSYSINLIQQVITLDDLCD